MPTAIGFEDRRGFSATAIGRGRGLATSGSETPNNVASQGLYAPCSSASSDALLQRSIHHHKALNRRHARPHGRTRTLRERGRPDASAVIVS